MGPKNRARKSTGTRTTASPNTRTLRQRGSAQRDSSESDEEEQSTLRLSNGKNKRFSRIQASDSCSDSTSDSDEAPGRKSVHEKNKPTKRQKVVRRRGSSSEVSEEDAIPSTSRAASTSQNASSLNKTASSPNQTVLQPGNLANLVNKCVYYLLITDQKKCMIKKKDIQKHVFAAPEYRFFNEVIKDAGTVLQKTYGIELVASEKRKGEYMLKNILRDVDHHEFIDYSPQEYQKRGFIFYLLTTIFMNGQSITDGELAAALKPLGIDLNARKLHPVFGDVSKYIKELASQHYVERKELNKDPPQYELTWGERAYLEVDKKELLEFYCQIDGDTRPEEWILQYNDAVPRREEPA